MKKDLRNLVLGLLVVLAALPRTSQAANNVAEIEFKNFQSDIEKTVKGPDGTCSYSYSYSIDWPVAGNAKAVAIAREWIKNKLSDDIDIDLRTLTTPEPIINRVVEKELSKFQKNDDDGLPIEVTEITIQATVSGSNCELKYEDMMKPYGSPKFFETTDVLSFNLGSGGTFSLDKLKTIANLNDLIWLSELGQNDWDAHESFVYNQNDVYSPIEDIPTPGFTEEGVTFNFPVFIRGLGGMDYPVPVPYDEIIPLMSDDAISFIPTEYLNNYYKDDGKLTEEIVRRLWWFGLPDHGRLSFYTGQALSGDFEKSLKSALKTDPDDENLYFWYAGNDTNENGMRIESVYINSQDDNKAKVTVNFDLYNENPCPYTLLLVKEPRVLRNGKQARKWVIDDFISDGYSKKERLKRIANKSPQSRPIF